jgi:hypothetical protein
LTPGKGYYSYDRGRSHIVALDSNCNKVGGCDERGRRAILVRPDRGFEGAVHFMSSKDPAYSPNIVEGAFSELRL